MYCSPKQFIDIAKSTGINVQDLYDILVTILSLMHRWGSLVKSKILQELISKESPQVSKMMDILRRIDQLNIKSLKQLCAGLEEEHGYHFSIRGKKISNLIQKKLADEFKGAAIDVIPTDTIELQVSGNGRWYKRSLDKDLNKMLG